jgi:hypothetical protein
MMMARDESCLLSSLAGTGVMLHAHEKERHDSFKERVKSLDHDHHESGQGEGPPVVLEPRAAALYPGPEIQG